MNEPVPLPQLIWQLAEALRTYDRLAFDEEYEHELGEPCSPQQIAVLEKKLGKSLPPSYKAFIQLHNGWSHFAGDAKLLSMEDHQSEWVKERLADMEELFPEFGQENPFEQGALPVLLGEDSNQVLYLDPRTVRRDGEMDFVLLDITTEERRFPDFTSFLSHKLSLLRRMIDNQTKGAAGTSEG
ncbi:SMI1/KNR4 family protein [Microvirga sp. 0TCS3.31]